MSGSRSGDRQTHSPADDMTQMTEKPDKTVTMGHETATEPENLH